MSLKTLTKAVEAGDLDLCRQLLATGAAIDNPDESGQWTPLQLACGNGHDHVARFLVEMGASFTSSPVSPAAVAAWHKNSELCRFLIDAGDNVNGVDSVGSTTLMLATTNNDADLCGFLLGHGADVHAKDDSGWNALLWAARFDSLAAAKVLIAAGADPFLALSFDRGPRLTAFQQAVCSNSIKMMQYFLFELGEEPAQRTIAGRTMQQLAGKHVEAKQWLQAAKTGGAVHQAIKADAGLGALAGARRGAAPAPI